MTNDGASRCRGSGIANCSSTVTVLFIIPSERIREARFSSKGGPSRRRPAPPPFPRSVVEHTGIHSLLESKSVVRAIEQKERSRVTQLMNKTVTAVEQLAIPPQLHALRVEASAKPFCPVEMGPGISLSNAETPWLAVSRAETLGRRRPRYKTSLSHFDVLSKTICVRQHLHDHRLGAAAMSLTTDVGSGSPAFSDRTQLFPPHTGPNVLPNDPFFARLLRHASRGRIVVRDLELGCTKTYGDALEDAVALRSRMMEQLSADAKRRLENGEEVFFGVLAPGGYEFTVAVLAVLAAGAAVVPMSTLIIHGNASRY